MRGDAGTGEIGAGSTSAEEIGAGSTSAKEIGAGSTSAKEIGAGSTSAEEIGAGSTSAEEIATLAEANGEGGLTARCGYGARLAVKPAIVFSINFCSDRCTRFLSLDLDFLDFSLLFLGFSSL
jgi:hypothetical protein